MASCPKCNAENPDGSQFCNKCGTPLSPTSEQRQDYSATPAELRPEVPPMVDVDESTQTGPVAGRLLGSGVITALAVLAVILVAAGWIMVRRQQEQRDLTLEATVTAVSARATGTAVAQLGAGMQATREAQSTAALADAQATAAHAPTATYQAITERYLRGIEAGEIGDWFTALAEFRAVFEVDPDYADVDDRIAQALAALTPTPTLTLTNTPAASSTPVPVYPTPTATVPPVTAVDGAISTATPVRVPPTPTWTPQPTHYANSTDTDMDCIATY